MLFKRDIFETWVKYLSLAIKTLSTMRSPLFGKIRCYLPRIQKIIASRRFPFSVQPQELWFTKILKLALNVSVLHNNVYIVVQEQVLNVGFQVTEAHINPNGPSAWSLTFGLLWYNSPHFSPLQRALIWNLFSIFDKDYKRQRWPPEGQWLVNNNFWL